MTTKEVQTDPRRALALLLVRRWARYRRSWHNLTPDERRNEDRRLKALKEEWAKGRMPIPSDSEDPSVEHILENQAGHFKSVIPTPQESYLTVEIVGEGAGFVHWSFLASHASKPWTWWCDGLESTGEARKQCLGILVLLSRVAWWRHAE